MKLMSLLIMALCFASSSAFVSHVTRRSTKSMTTRRLGSKIQRAVAAANDDATSTESQATSPVGVVLQKEDRYQAAKEKRRKFVGMAKAVDRGQFAVTYSPRPFLPKSGLPDRTQLFTVLGIESSCDDTGAAVIRSDGVILGEALASQNEIHEVWGGVVPGLARDAHVEKIDSVIEQALANANMTSVDQVDAIGATVGPGLEICLRVGAYKARELAIQYEKPFVGVHHLEAHILMARIGSGVLLPATPDTHAAERSMNFPFLALLVSGGHCQLMKCHGIGNYTIIGGTIDDSLGEAFDKTARLLGLPVGGGGGPAVERLAKDGDRNSIKLPIPLQKRKKDCDFSYAGLKTAVRIAADKLRIERGLETTAELPHQDKANIAASFQHVAILHIEHRLVRAMQTCSEDGITTLAVVGGVAANQALRSRLDAICADAGWSMHVPPPRLCTDQGAMSAWAAVERIMVGSTDVAHSQEVYARYPFSLEGGLDNQ